MVFYIEPERTIIINKCYDYSKFSCFPLYNMSGCRLLISIGMNEMLKYHYRRQGSIYASENVIKNKRLFGYIYIFINCSVVILCNISIMNIEINLYDVCKKACVQPLR